MNWLYVNILRWFWKVPLYIIEQVCVVALILVGVIYIFSGLGLGLMIWGLVTYPCYLTYTLCAINSCIWIGLIIKDIKRNENNK